MLQELLNRVEKVLDEQVRPALKMHGGNLEVLSLVGSVLKFRLLGHCSGCPSSYLTTEQLIKKEVTDAIPEISEVMLVTQVSDDLLEAARVILSHRTELRNPK